MIRLITKPLLKFFRIHYWQYFTSPVVIYNYNKGETVFFVNRTCKLTGIRQHSSAKDKKHWKANHI